MQDTPRPELLRRPARWPWFVAALAAAALIALKLHGDASERARRGDEAAARSVIELRKRLDDRRSAAKPGGYSGLSRP